MKRIKYVLLALVVLCFSVVANAQTTVRPQVKHQVALSTNILDWAYIGGINAAVAVNVSQHVTLELAGVANPFKAKFSGKEFQNKQLTGEFSVKYWPWHAFSGWWFQGKAKFSDYAKTGIFESNFEDGKAIGGGIGLGYTLMLSKHINLDFGVSMWGGRKYDFVETSRRGSEYGKLLDAGHKYFVDFDKISLSIMYVF